MNADKAMWCFGAAARTVTWNGKVCMHYTQTIYDNAVENGRFLQKLLRGWAI